MKDHNVSPGEALFRTFNVQQSALLEEQAGRNGLLVEVYLLPEVAAWLLAAVREGQFETPNVAINTMLARESGGQGERHLLPGHVIEVTIANAHRFADPEDIANRLRNNDRLYHKHGPRIGPVADQPAEWQHAMFREATSA